VTLKNLKLKAVHYSPITVGLGSHYVHVVQVKKTGDKIVLCAADAAPIPEDPDRRKAVTQVLDNLILAGRFRGRQAALCLKGDDLFVQHQRMSLEGPKDVEERVREELRRNVPFDMDEAQFRYITTGRIYEQNRFRDELIMMVVAREVTDLQLAVLADLKLEGSFIGVEPVGLHRSLLRFPPPAFAWNEVTAFMNMGSSKTDLIIIREGRLVFTRSLPMGGRKIVQTIAEKLETDAQSATRLKEAVSRREEVNETLRTALLSATRPILEGLSAEVLSCFRYYASIFNREWVNRLVVAGQEVGGLVDPKLLEEQVGVPVISWEPEVFHQAESHLALGREFDSGFTSVIGTAIEALEPSEVPVDFMPPEVVVRTQRKKSTMLRGSSLGLLVLLMFLFFFITHQRRQKLDEVRNMIQSRSDLIDTKTMGIQALGQEVELLQARHALLMSAHPEIRVSRVLGEIARSANEGIFIRKLTVENVRPLNRKSEEEEEADSQETSSYLIRINGLARSTEDMSTFVADLSQTRAFSSLFDEGFEDVTLRDWNLKSFTLTLTVGKGVRNEVF
jgi:type IV pilus assembly protein PilM